MGRLKTVQTEIQTYISHLKSLQFPDGSWRFLFETGPMTDANMIILLKNLDTKPELIPQLAQRLKQRQAPNGAWKQYDDEVGHLSSTVEAYTALLLSGCASREDVMMQKAEEYIVQHGGVEQAHVSTKFMLALNGLYPWPRFFPLPLYLIQLPKSSSFSYYRWSSYVRSHFASLLILGHRKFKLHHPREINIHHLFVTQHFHKLREPRRSNRTRERKKKGYLSRSALKKTEQILLQNIENDGTQYSYASATFFMIYSLLAIGYKTDSPMIKQAVEGLVSFGYTARDGSLHIQNSPSTVWDTALIAYTLQEAGVSTEDAAILRAAKYLLSLQHLEKQESERDSRHRTSGGWGFSESNTANPDVDDTQAVIRVLTRLAAQESDYSAAWRKGIQYVFRMQNDDGGWAAFEKNSVSSIIRLFRIPHFAETAADPSCADITGRVLELLGNHLKLRLSHPRIQDGLDWLVKKQKSDGSWYGRWGVSFIYGTWAAVTGMAAAGLQADHPAIRRAVDWLLRIRHEDGGWGESCRSDFIKKYNPAPYSTVVHTAWALDALIAVHDNPTEVIDQGILRLIEWNRQEGRRTTYPAGAGLPGHFYIHYHSYPLVWPLLTLSHYVQKYQKQP
ncbi:prenyltransferase/squalene oxidase repeat-containing protein [Paenibacillus sp. Cedars]|uniref:terpene cyclase/mutase family protein n=1 Tax=Paenibacillus sp. Cedars TaxID=1980674 RepID=UPI001162CFBD|nr:prenyltransferase/squalene oxidase repeat-containing protein [Paenibacillus sp. Cedars]AWP27746.1 squalene--hopene cyclase [Paenibacillus sp. Cedars]